MKKQSEKEVSSRLLEQAPAEIKVEKDAENNLDDQAAATCRICMDSRRHKDDELISPCMCKGNQQFVHRSCLDHWRSVKENYAFLHCTTCKAQFHLRVVDFGENSWRKMRLRLFVARDVILVFLAVLTVIALIGGLEYLADKDGHLRNAFVDWWGRINFRILAYDALYYSIVGAIVVFVLIVIIIGIMLLSFSNRGSGYSNLPGARGYYYDDSMAACCGPAVLGVVVLSLVLGIGYVFFSAAIAIQGIWQRRYHILTKRELTQEYVVEDLHGCYTPAKLDPKHEERLKNLKLF